MDDKDQFFSYTYSAAQRAEIEKIRSKYTTPREDKMAKLRALDRSASRKARIWSIVLGIVGTLVLGLGLSFILTELGAILGAYQALSLFTGIGLGLAGLVLVALAYPVYNTILQKQRRRIAPEILRLTDELLQ